MDRRPVKREGPVSSHLLKATETEISSGFLRLLIIGFINRSRPVHDTLQHTICIISKIKMELYLSCVYFAPKYFQQCLGVHIKISKNK